MLSCSNILLSNVSGLSHQLWHQLHFILVYRATAAGYMHTTHHQLTTHIVGAVAVIDVDLPLAAAKEDDLAVRRPLDVGQLHPSQLLAPDTVPIH